MYNRVTKFNKIARLANIIIIAIGAYVFADALITSSSNIYQYIAGIVQIAAGTMLVDKDRMRHDKNLESALDKINKEYKTKDRK